MRYVIRPRLIIVRSHRYVYNSRLDFTRFFLPTENVFSRTATFNLRTVQLCAERRDYRFWTPTTIAEYVLIRAILLLFRFFSIHRLVIKNRYFYHTHTHAWPRARRTSRTVLRNITRRRLTDFAYTRVTTRAACTANFQRIRTFLIRFGFRVISSRPRCTEIRRERYRSVDENKDESYCVLSSNICTLDSST